MATHAIHLDHVSCAYEASVVLRDVSLRIPPGQFVGMIGPSGAGKTTLLRSMLGLVPRVDGEVTVRGRAVAPGRPPSGVGYVPQVETVDWGFPVTVENVVLMGKVGRMGPWPWPSRADRREVAETLQRLGIGQLGGRHIRELSGGPQQRTFLARALIGRPRLLFLDEPTASVDVKTRDDILHLLVQLNRDDGVTVVMTTHELNTVAAHLPWVVCVNAGIVAQGPPTSIFTAPILSRTFGTEMRVVRDLETGNLLVAEAGTHGPFSSRQPSAASHQLSATG
ncbi:MAG: zinc/manganese transport system ATP-binding protein [Thermomicrobiales bacterium]|nr:zinc/manganese transport system ATP-binding protein [Thermomicrobiales bacterium]